MKLENSRYTSPLSDHLLTGDGALQQEKGLSMNTQYHKNLSSPRTFIAIFCTLGGGAIGTTHAGMNMDEYQAQMEPMIPNTYHELDRHPEFNESQFDIDMVLDILIKYLILILEDPTTGDIPLNQGGETLSESANLLIMGHPIYGLASDLTVSEKVGGLENANEIIDLLDKSQNEINLSIQTQNTLRDTVETIIGELINGE